MTDPKDWQLFWPCGTPRSQNNAFTSSGYPVPLDLRRENAAALAGANSAATKRARGQDLIPRLHLKGSKRRVREKEPA